MLIEALRPLLGSFREQVVLVTGASSGIGRETALTFGRLGARVALAARRRNQLAEVARAITKAGGQALVAPTDVGDLRSVRACVNKVRRTWSRLDMLVNNAGVLIPSPVEQLKASDLDAMLRVNLIGPLFMMQAALPVMRRQGSGTIINVASLAGRRGITPVGGYCASKFALVGLIEALRIELGDTPIHVGLVMPGVVDTAMAEFVKQDEVLAGWPSALNMPPEWVTAAILLAARFKLHEISVPPGAATVEILAALAPATSDTLIRWGRAATRLWAGVKPGRKPRRA